MSGGLKGRCQSARLSWLSLTLLLGSMAVQAQTQLGGAINRPVIPETDVPLERIQPRAVDGFTGEALLRKPPGDGPFPAVILVHGGAPRWPTDTLQDYARHIHASRFLASGYVVVVMTRRELDLELPHSEVQPAVLDSIAMYDHVRTLPYVDSDSVVVRGTSVGGYLTLEVAAARDVPAIMVEEPFSFPFVSIRPGEGSAGQSADTSKIERITAPILLVRGDQTRNINDFNRDVVIPAIESVGKSLEVMTYPGELHSFAFYDSQERTLNPWVSRQVFREIDSFFREHIEVAPAPLDRELVHYESIGRP